MILLDTHTLLWALEDDPRLGPEARRLLLHEALAVSVVALWEIAIKAGLGKLGADVAEVARAADAEGMRRLGIADAHLAAYQALPRRAGHGDPFDRMLAAQARVEGWSVLTADAKLSGYGAAMLDATR